MVKRVCKLVGSSLLTVEKCVPKIINAKVEHVVIKEVVTAFVLLAAKQMISAKQMVVVCAVHQETVYVPRNKLVPQVLFATTSPTQEQALLEHVFPRQPRSNARATSVAKVFVQVSSVLQKQRAVERLVILVTV